MIARILHLLVGSVLLAAGLLGQEDEKRLEAVREFKRTFGQFKETSQKVEAIFTLKPNECVAAAEVLVEKFDHDEEPVRLAAMDVLSTYTQPTTFLGLMQEMPKIKKPERRARLIEVLGRAKIKEALPILREILTKEKSLDQPTRYQSARALATIGNETCEDLLQLLLVDKDALVRMAAADAAGALRLPGVGATLVKLLEDPNWQVQVAAVQACSKIRVEAAIGPLITVMKRGGRLREETAEALFRITAYDFGADPDQWERQWKRLQELKWRMPSEAELAKAAEARKKSDALYGKKGETSSFAGITTSSTKILFIIDISGSMGDRVVETEKFQGYADLRKITIAKTELIRTLEGFKDNVEFNIVAFATRTKYWKKHLVPAQIVNKQAAKNWVENLQPIGGSEAQELANAGLGGAAALEEGKTNTYAGLMTVFGIDADKQESPAVLTGGATDPAVLKNRLDTVFFLSDGQPSVGKLIDTDEIRKAVKKLNETYRVVMHAIAIGEFQREFMRGIANDNGGVFVDLGK